MVFWKKDTATPQTFAALIRGLEHSVNSALDMLESKNVEMLTRFSAKTGSRSQGGYRLTMKLLLMFR